MQFNIKVAKLIQFFEKSAAKGVVTVTSKEKITRHFFKYFYLHAKDNMLFVKAVDYAEKSMFIRHFLTNVNIIEEGTLKITDVELVLDVLKSIKKTREISFNYDEEKHYLNIETIDEGSYSGYRLRLAVPDDKEKIALKNSKNNVETWDIAHKLEDGKLSITVGDQTAFYNTIVKFNKTTLKEVIDDSTNLTLDQKIRVSMKDGKIFFRSGNKSDPILSNKRFDIQIENPIEFEDKIITNLHPIINSLGNEFTMYLRLAGDKSLKFWIRSIEEDIELNFCSSSI